MPITPKPLFRPDALRPKLAGFTLPAGAAAARAKIVQWAELFGTKQAEQMEAIE